MKKQIFMYCMLFISSAIFSQAGHIMQGVGAVNMSMGGAATAQPLDINGALQWNPAAISAFSGREVSLSAGLFFSDPTLKSSFGPFSGETADDRGTSIMPALAFVWGKEGSKHTFGVSAFGISGFGVTFPQDTNYPQDLQGNGNPDFDPTAETNPISFPQFAGGFGHIESDYILLQVGFAYSYKLSEKVSIGVQPTINYATLELAPNPTSAPSQTLGYPTTDAASAIGFGGQIGVFYDSGKMLKLGASYKTKQEFSDLTFDNTYLDGTTAPENNFQMNYPAIISVGMGLSGKKLDFALDFRYVDYENTEGFAESGWAIDEASGFPTGAVNGFGWDSMTILSAGLQYKITENFPIRIGYTHSSNPISDELAFFSIPATAVIENAAQIGFGYQVTDKFKVDAVYHQGFRGDGASGQLLNPTPQGFGGPWDATNNPLGAIPGSSVSYDMETSMIQFTFSYKLN